jgi:hypothetical protein
VREGELSARAVSERLADRIDGLARQLLPGGFYGQGRRHWRCGSIAGESGQSLVVWLDGTKRGRWKDYSSGEGGDALDLAAAVLHRNDLGAAFKWALDWLGIGELDPAEADRLQRQAEAARDQRRHQAEREARINAQDAKKIWLAGKPLTEGDLAWRYFLGRGVDLRLLDHEPRALRLHPGLWNPESRRAWPALVAAICAPDGTHINTHRIWLELRSDGSVAKAPLERAKLSMPGGYPGGCVRLWNGASGKPWKTMPADETLVAGEGLEDTLTIACSRPEWRYVAVLSVSSLGPLVVPDQVTRLIWIGQNDPKGSPAAKALARGLALHRQAGRRTLIIRPTRDVKDVNELAQLIGLEDEDDEPVLPPHLAPTDIAASVRPPAPLSGMGEVAWPS